MFDVRFRCSMSDAEFDFRFGISISMSMFEYRFRVLCLKLLFDVKFRWLISVFEFDVDFDFRAASSYKWESLAYQQTITMCMDCYFAIFLLYLNLIMTRPIKFASMLAEQASPTRSSSSSSKTEHGQLGANTKHTHAALPPQQRASWRVLEDLGLTP